MALLSRYLWHRAIDAFAVGLTICSVPIFALVLILRKNELPNEQSQPGNGVEV
jgi:hypothetical protein